MTNGTEMRAAVLALLRIATAYMFILHGTAKLLGVPHVEMFDGLELFSIYGVAGVLEVFGGLMVLLGWQTRAAAFVLSGLMAVAYFIAHASADTVLLPFLNGGEAAALFSFVFLYLAVAGAGKWSLDAALAGKK